MDQNARNGTGKNVSCIFMNKTKTLVYGGVHIVWRFLYEERRIKFVFWKKFCIAIVLCFWQTKEVYQEAKRKCKVWYGRWEFKIL